jgi:hypothetical protein
LTFAQNIIEFQKRKEKLAKFTFDDGLGDSLTQKLEVGEIDALSDFMS